MDCYQPQVWPLGSPAVFDFVKTQDGRSGK
jgi:hypothetical protein